jgi:hypothetical protein
MIKNWRYERDEHLRRVTLRLARHIREYYEETGYSHSRFFDSMFIPDELVTVGISEAARSSPVQNRRREHVVSLKVIMDYVLDMIEINKEDSEISKFIFHHTQTVFITIDEAREIDMGSGKQNMPAGMDWAPYHDIYSRLSKIPWSRCDGRPIEDPAPSALQAEGQELRESCKPIRRVRLERALANRRAQRPSKDLTT